MRSAVAGTGVPVVTGVDCGHVPPQLSLVNGAPAELTLAADGRATLRQQLIDLESFDVYA